jgi:hypothetical protein
MPESWKPPAWREPQYVPHEYMHVEEEELEADPGTPVEMVEDVVATLDAKGKPLGTAVPIAKGTVGGIIGAGPDFIVFQYGEHPGVRVPKGTFKNLVPKEERRRGCIVVVTAADLDG